MSKKVAKRGKDKKKAQDRLNHYKNYLTTMAIVGSVSDMCHTAHFNEVYNKAVSRLTKSHPNFPLGMTSDELLNTPKFIEILDGIMTNPPADLGVIPDILSVCFMIRETQQNLLTVQMGQGRSMEIMEKHFDYITSKITAFDEKFMQGVFSKSEDEVTYSEHSITEEGQIKTLDAINLCICMLTTIIENDRHTKCDHRVRVLLNAFIKLYEIVTPSEEMMGVKKKVTSAPGSDAPFDTSVYAEDTDSIFTAADMANFLLITV